MAGRRARGANAQMPLGIEASYGDSSSVANWFLVPFVTENLGEEQPLDASDVLGFGRVVQDPGQGAIDNVGDVVVPLCARNMGLWFTLLYGEPDTTAGVAATGSITFSAQPVNNATVSVAGQAFTFTTGTPTANQVKIGPSLKQTIANAVRVLNQSAVAGVAAASYWATADGKTIQVLHDSVGVAGNSFALATSTTPASNATASGSTLSGGSATGGYRHVWYSAEQTLPSASVEVGMPEVPSFAMNYGLKANTLGVPLQRSGNLNATINCIVQGELPIAAVTATSGVTTLEMKKFSSFSGLALRNGSPFGAELVGGQLNYSNGMDAVPTVGRGDGRIGGVDEGMPSFSGVLNLRYNSTEVRQQAENGEAVELVYAWAIPATTFALRITIERMFVPKAKSAITGPGAVQADYNWQGAGRMKVVLDNDVSEYLVPEPA
ncbi:MAG: phage tail tube protein [Brevundimonas sp.]